ncbi:unnamed protein product [Amaranthus hypochondriacus]
MQAPSTDHYNALLHTLNYVYSTIGQGILLKASTQLSLQAFSDSDWASCPNSRRSVTGYILLLGNSPISWKSKKQATVSRSSSEAEYRALATASSEITWVVRLLEDLGITNLNQSLYIAITNLHFTSLKTLSFTKEPNTLKSIVTLLVIRFLKDCCNLLIYPHVLK